MSHVLAHRRRRRAWRGGQVEDAPWRDCLTSSYYLYRCNSFGTHHSRMSKPSE
jgi:hypothetical protein